MWQWRNWSSVANVHKWFPIWQFFSALAETKQVQHPIIQMRRQVTTDASQNKGFPDCALFHANLIYFPQFLTHWHLMASRVRLASSSWGHAKFGSRQPGASKWEYFFKPRVAHRTPVEDSFSEPIFFLREKSEPPALTNSRDQGVKRLMA